MRWPVFLFLRKSFLSILQTSLNSIREELENIRETSQAQRKRFLDMILVLLRDVGDIGGILGGQMNEHKVGKFSF